MAEFSVRGYVSTINTEKDRVKVVVNEYKKGYTTKTEVVEDRNIKWTIYFPRYFTKFIPNNFKQGNMVEIKGEILMENRKNVLIKGQTINMYSIRDISKDLSLKRISKHNEEEPDIENYLAKDFT